MLLPGLLFATIFSSACDQAAPPPANNTELCYAEVTAITAVQGDGYHSPLQDSKQLVSGAVTYIDPETGYFLEQPGDGRPGAASRALFVEQHGEARGLRVGQNVVVGGRVVERGERRDKLTTLADVDRFALCESSLPLPLTQVQLPLSNMEREALEGMRVVLPQDLYVTDVYSHYRGKLTLSAGSPLRVPTEDMAPGEKAEHQGRDNRDRSIDIQHDTTETAVLGAGSQFELLMGVMGHDGREQLLMIEERQGQLATTAEPLAPAPAGGLRIVNANLLNYFNGDGRGGGFPNERGAETRQELDRQEQKIRAAMARIKPDLLAVQELENDGFGANSAAQSLVALLNDAGNGDYAVVRAPGDRLGADVITVGLFYRKLALEPVGPSHTLASEPFDGLSRQPLAQLFRDRASGELLLLAANHLKSKGSCPESGPNTRQGDGQGCWNLARTEAVEALLPWLGQLARDAGTENVLILGDMNAYRMEDPIQAFRRGAYTELVEDKSGLPQYSYRFFGQSGTLDYAFASPALADAVQQATIWHINSDWPQKMELPQSWLRMSDHDPVIVDLGFPGQP